MFGHGMGIIQLLILFGCIICVLGSNISTYRGLHDFVFKDYDAEIQPMPTDNGTLNIDVMFHLFAFNSFNEVEGVLSLVGAISFFWTDESLIWNKTLFDGIEQIIVPQSKVWTPKIILVNGADTLAWIGSDSSFNVQITNSGSLIWTPGSVLNAKCSVDVLKFPFDSHSCKLLLSGFGYHDTLRLLPISATTENSHLILSQQWELESTSVEVDLEHQSSFEVVINFKRKPVYYTVLVFTPTAVLALLNPLIFLLPIECGERLSFGMTILLSYMVFLTLVSDKIPTTSNPMSFMVIYIILLFVTSAFITMCNIINMKLYGSNESEVTRFQRCFISSCSKYRQKDSMLDVSEQKKKPTTKDFVRILDKIYVFFFYSTILIIFVAYLTVTAL
ncbi:unnamed protein product [Mytilus coruscus]|uniref:CHRNN n=1 Tax=Mytilus coruscus TaxID=42192 RepID=A0A6J8E9L7_MYTCO|nr:unnamed protein product [Mytilus coruscus]